MYMPCNIVRARHIRCLPAFVRRGFRRVVTHLCLRLCHHRYHLRRLVNSAPLCPGRPLCGGLIARVHYNHVVVSIGAERIFRGDLLLRGHTIRTVLVYLPGRLNGPRTPPYLVPSIYLVPVDAGGRRDPQLASRVLPKKAGWEPTCRPK